MFRMDDLDEDWEIDKRTTGEEYLEDGGGCECNVRWVLEKGFNLGKKAVITGVITGVVMSSAPVVLPPILVVSAVGFACSVPFGLVFTGYACTQKLMSKLVPMPTTSPMLEYDHVFDDEWEEVEGRREGKYRIESGICMEGEEKEQMDDLRAGVEERIELVKNEVPWVGDEDSNDIRRDDPKTSENISLKEEGNDELVANSTQSSEEMVAQADVGQEEAINQESKRVELLPKEDALKPSEDQGEWEVTELKIEGDKGIEESINEEEDIKRVTIGLLEKIKDEGNADDAAKERKNKKRKNKNKKKTTSKGSAETSLPEVKDQSTISKYRTVGDDFTEKQQSGPDKTQKVKDNRDVSMQQPPVRGAGSDDLISLQENITTLYPLGGSEETSVTGGAEPMAISNVDVVKISVTASIPKVTDEASSEVVDSVLPTEKEFVDEEKIWEQINALRMIVGYKATPYRSSIEEVKALYTFTGIELPSSVGNSSDLEELSNKLRVLMSFLGVK